MQVFLETILAITNKAERIPRQHFRQGLDIIHKADESPVTIADQACEQYIRDAIGAAFPDHGIIGEEFAQKHGKGPYSWIIDPIDGTRAFISGMPLYGMLIGLLKDGEPVLGVVRMPALGEVFTGSKDGAFLNGAPIQVSTTRDLNKAMIYINEADKMMRDAPDVFARLNKAGQDRRFCYDCYPHALLAAGHIDACIDYDLKPYDYLPLAPVITAAGGMVTDWDGKALDLHSDGRVVAAATPALHRELLDVIQGT